LLIYLTGSFIRPCLISVVYIIFALIGPLLTPFSSTPVSRTLRLYLFLVLLTSLVFEVITQPDIDDYTKTCNKSVLNFWLRQIGLIRIKYGAGFDSIRVILPELLALAASFITAICCTIISRSSDEQLPSVGPLFQETPSEVKPNKLRTVGTVILTFKKLSDVAVILIIGFAGIIQVASIFNFDKTHKHLQIILEMETPSLLNSVYFIAFLFVTTFWASHKPFQRRFYNTVKLLIMYYSMLHFLLLYIYQIPFFQIIIGRKSFVARFLSSHSIYYSVIGFVPVFYIDCNMWWSLNLDSSNYWTVFVNILIVLGLYHFLIVQYDFTRYGIRHSQKTCGSAGSSIHEELLASEGDSQNLGSQALSQKTSASGNHHNINTFLAEPENHKTEISQGLSTMISILSHQFYVFSLLSIMLWALLYHSLFGLIFLLQACIILVFKNTRQMAFRASPLILAYAIFLYIAQYIYSMDIKQELPHYFYLELLGFTSADDPVMAFLTLLVKGLLSLPLFALLRFHLHEKYYGSTCSDRQYQLYGNPSTVNPNLILGTNLTTSYQYGSVAVSWLRDCLVKYWIFVVTSVLLIISIQTPPVLYTVGFFVLFGVLIHLLLFSLNYFRRILYCYYTFLTIYTSVVLVILYCYQFPAVPSIWREATGLDENWNQDIGLINYNQERNSGALFIRLIIPISLFIVVMLQLKFFHDLWCQLVTASSNATDAVERPCNDQSSFCTGMKRVRKCLQESFWNIAEVHVAKFVLLILVIIVVNDVCALNLAVVILISFAIYMPSLFSALSILLCTLLSCIAILRMVYQMHFVVEVPLPVYSKDIICNSSDYSLDATAYWLGFRKVSNIRSCIGGLIFGLVAFALQSIVLYRQRYKRLVSGKTSSFHGSIFPEADPKNWDASLIDMTKFFFNYGFQKFGLELSMTMMALVAWVRMDFLAALLFIWLMVFVFSSRGMCRCLWPLFLLYLTVMFPLQYALYVGLPPSLCIDYPWSDWLSNPLQNDNLIFWLDLADYRFQLDAKKTVADFLLLLLVACQARAFQNEETSPAGNNKSIYVDKKENGIKMDNPTYDFLTHQRSFVDYLKIVVFMYGHWITIVMVLVAGLGGVSLFALGYIILAFWMLWKGTSLYVMCHYRKALFRWNLILYYTVLVMFCKIILQIFACAFIDILMKANLCYIRQLFSIVCVSVIPGRTNNFYLPEEQLKFDNECTVQTSETQIGFDALAFGFLVLQIRALNSWYFQHCVVEYRSEAVLMNRGAILQNQLIEKEMIEQKKHQEKKFRDIKIRTEQIRKDYEKRTNKIDAFVPQTYGQAKRAGDYYMVEYDPSEDAPNELVETFIPEVDSGAVDFNKLDPAQLIHTAAQHDLDLAETLEAVECAEQIENEEKRMIRAVSDETQLLEKKIPSFQSQSCKKSESGKQILAGARFIYKIFTSSLAWFAAFLNRRCREHRYVAYVLGKERQKLKERLKQPLVDASTPIFDVRQEFEQQNLHCVSSASDIERLESEVEDCWKQQNVFARFVTAVGYCIAAHTDVICYLLAIIDHARCAGIISLPLPLLVFFWGSLANPRPTWTFWVAMITYTELAVVIKFIAQFGFFPFNNTANIIKAASSADYLPGILGIRKADYYAFWDIALLVALFFHRYMLRRLGLWKKAGDMSIKSDISLDMDIPTTTAHSGLIKRTKHFFNMLFNPPVRYIKDLYPFMFLMDVLCVFVVSFGFSSFDYGGTGSVVRDISSNRVPITFVLMLMVISLMIIVDRALYLRKAVKCKFLYQLVTVIFLHIWIFFALPQITYKPAWLNKTAQFLYCVKCIYLLISAWQIRNGYPTLCAGNLITHAYGLSNMVFFKLFMAIPFLFELRTATDWTWTDTSMPLFDFFNMENFYAIIYNLKCARTYEKRFPAPRGVAKGSVVKYLMGLPVILSLILFIWLPLLSFSLLNRIGIIMPPNNVMLTLGVEGYPSMFKIEAQGIELEFLTDGEYLQLQNAFSQYYNSSDEESIMRVRHAVAFIKEYSRDSIMKIRFRPESDHPWLISNDALLAMKYELEKGTKKLNAYAKLKFERPSKKHADDSSQHFYTLTIPLPLNSTIRNNLTEIVDGQYNISVLLENAWPPYVILPNEGDVKPATSLLYVISGSNFNLKPAFCDLSMRLTTFDTMENKVWNSALIESNETASLTLPLEDVKYEKSSEKKYLQMVVFVDRVFPSFLSKYVQGGIIAMYIAVVMLAGRIIRGIVTSSPMEVMISEIPNPDHLLKICLDIYLVREAKDFVLEQDLFGKLIFLFRSPENLIKWTRYKVKKD
uniref:Piezo-type mechanosensitive ion channel component n=1 Tax=Thelazia callipaeda TaxID=103827 RepID=A0A158RCN6_THECL